MYPLTVKGKQNYLNKFFSEIKFGYTTFSPFDRNSTAKAAHQCLTHD